jgi:hypothetical protein
MANISISDLYSSDADALLTSLDDKEGSLIKSAVNRALEVRGGLVTTPGVPTSTEGGDTGTGRPYL